ncbi:helix-turn-helix transcriptional regulator [Streptomyces sp. NPDC048445]|uniref:helix-turn-helix transcriptional regulator n=1 Tax=Streptomyces sp. NPDC048445 TaxID=3365553 RepID=UPI0037158367
MTTKRQPTPGTDTAALVGALLAAPDGAEKLFGARLRVLREQWGYSQEELSRVMQKAGFKWQQTTTAKTEAGKRPVRLNEAHVLAAHFGVSIDDMLSEEFISEEIDASVAAFNLGRSILAATQMRFEALQAHRNAVDSEIEEIGALMTDMLGTFENTKNELTGQLQHLIAEADAEIAKLGGKA